MMLQGMRELGLGVVNEVATVMHSVSARFAYARFKSCGLWALETPRASSHLPRQCQHRHTHGRRKHAEPEACMRPSSARV